MKKRFVLNGSLNATRWHPQKRLPLCRFRIIRVGLRGVTLSGGIAVPGFLTEKGSQRR